MSKADQFLKVFFDRVGQKVQISEITIGVLYRMVKNN